MASSSRPASSPLPPPPPDVNIQELLEKDLTEKERRAQDDVEELIKHVVRAFYPDIYSVVIEAVLEHKILKDSDRVLRIDEDEQARKEEERAKKRESIIAEKKKRLVEEGLDPKQADDVIDLFNVDEEDLEDETVANVRNRNPLALYMGLTARQMRRYLAQLLDDGLVQQFEEVIPSDALPKRCFGM